MLHKLSVNHLIWKHFSFFQALENIHIPEFGGEIFFFFFFFKLIFTYVCFPYFYWTSTKRKQDFFQPWLCWVMTIPPQPVTLGSWRMQSKGRASCCDLLSGSTADTGRENKVLSPGKSGSPWPGNNPPIRACKRSQWGLNASIFMSGLREVLANVSAGPNRFSAFISVECLNRQVCISAALTSCFKYWREYVRYLCPAHEGMWLGHAPVNCESAFLVWKHSEFWPGLGGCGVNMCSVRPHGSGILALSLSLPRELAFRGMK